MAVRVAGGGSDAQRNVIVPSASVDELIRLLDGVKGNVVLDVGNSCLRADFGDVELLTKLIDGTYPPFQKVIPKEFQGGFTVARDVLLRALHRAAIMATDKYKAVRMTLAASTLTVTSSNPELEEACEELDVEGNAELSIEMSFNVGYLTEALTQMKGTKLRFDFGAAMSGLIRDPDDSDFSYTVMGLKT